MLEQNRLCPETESQPDKRSHEESEKGQLSKTERFRTEYKQLPTAILLKTWVLLNLG